MRLSSIAICFLVNTNNDSTTKSDIMLKSVFDVRNLTVTRPSTKLPCKFYIDILSGLVENSQEEKGCPIYKKIKTPVVTCTLG